MIIHPSFKGTKFWIILICTILLVPSIRTLRCLVVKPGRGLVSERCSRFASSCRVRVENDAVVWYTSKLYDRNQLACVMRNEYAAHERSGCIRKQSGSVRCWCYGQSNCNNPENMVKLYETFKTGDMDILDQVIDDIETSDNGDYEDSKAALNPSTTNSEVQIPEAIDILPLEKNAAENPSPQEASDERVTGSHSRMKLIKPHKDEKSNYSEGTTPLSLFFSNKSVNNRTANRNGQKQQNRYLEVIQPTKAIKVLPMTDEESNEGKGLSGEERTQVQNERKTRRKEPASGIVSSDISASLISILVFLYYV